MKKLSAVFAVWFIVSFMASPQTWGQPVENVFSSNPVVAVVDGEPVMLDDLKNSKIQDLLLQVYEMQNSLLKQIIHQKLIKNHPELKKVKIPQVSQKDIVRFYKTTPGINELGTLKQMQGEIKKLLDRLAKVQYYETQYQKAVEKEWVQDYFEPPNDFHIVAGIGTAVLRFGKKPGGGRKVMVLEFSDFQCPFCKRVQGTLAKLRKDYADRVQFGYRHFPLPFHKEAGDLAEAVECAREQGKFWELQAHFYRVAPAVLKRKDMNQHAARAGVKDLKAFQACMDKKKYKTRVARDFQEGLKLGIQGTPTFIVGAVNPQKHTVTGEMFSGAISEDKFVDKIEKYLSLAEDGGEVSTAAVNP